MYGPSSSYVVSLCRPDGTVDEQENTRIEDESGATTLPTATSVSKGDRATVWQAAVPAGVGPKVRRRTSYDRKLAASRANRIPPADRSRLTPFGSASTTLGGGASTASVLGNKCVHNEWGSTYNWNPARGFGFVFAMAAPDWRRTRIADGVWTWTGLLNYCGWTQSSPRVWATYVGDAATFQPQRDGVNQIGWWWAQGCGATMNAIGCTINYLTDGRIVESDAWYYHDWAWSADGSCSPGETWDLWETAAHEWGHAFGASHAPSIWAQDQVMYPVMQPCSTDRRNLGLGDFNFLMTTYPY
ncbi:hypothetical protein [Patulibacter defluvii]|uniref:hypothetical protein n=1 Tax=Patulibacter defluvii TaxID=3095358 RepID=UPI002A753539|nr:hypothetical protein [Patulibacter sp. DM4]